jgi:5-methylcytosine-specific restriction enzyme A
MYTKKVERQRGRKWMVRQRRQLRLQPLCAACKALGVVTVAEEVDHVVALANGGSDEDSNLQSLCAPCHAEKTAADLGYTPRKRIRYDGWPEE